MSNHLRKHPSLHKKPTTWPLPAVLLLVAALLSIYFISRPQPHANWNVSDGRVLDTRITLQGYHDASQANPASIYYRGEADVTYSANGMQYTQWIPVTNMTPDREWLAFRLSRRKDDSADVRWNPSNPQQAEATLHLR